MEVPSTAWRDAAWDAAEARAAAPIPARLLALPGTVRHGFTHFALELTVLLGRVPAGEPAPAGALWCPVDRLGEHALPTAMKKVVRHALAARDALLAGPLGA